MISRRRSIELTLFPFAIAAAMSCATAPAPSDESKKAEAAPPSETAETPKKTDEQKSVEAPSSDAFMKSERMVALPPEANKLDTEGVDLIKKHKFAEAIDAFTRSLAIKADNPRALANRGTAYVAVREPDKALADFDRALALEPDLKNVLTVPTGLAHSIRGQMRYQAGKKDDALKDFKAAMQVDPKNPAPHSELAYIAHLERDESKCLEEAGKAIEIDPNFAQAYGNRGECYHVLEQDRAALSDFNMAIKLDSKNGVYYLGRAKVRIDMGKQFEAQKDAERAAALDPKLQEAADPMIKGTALPRKRGITR